MIKHPITVAIFLLSIEIFILFLASHRWTKKYFDIIPSIFWIYFLPMVASSCGFIPAKSDVYALATTWALPTSLFILLFTVDVPAIVRLGGKALLMFFVGAAGIGFGAVVAFSLFKGYIGPQFWSGFGALSGSWTGGSANMIAVKEALSTPDEVFLPMVVVDTVVPYLWMGILVIGAQHQQLFDKFFNADRRILEKLNQAHQHKHKENKGLGWLTSTGIVLLGLAGAGLAVLISNYLPEIKNVITKFAWGIIIVSTLGIVCSFSSLRKLETYGSNKIGYFILYFVLTTIGAKASISHLGNAVILIVAGAVIVFIHISVLLVAAKIIRAPMFLVAVASQANVGGVASAPMVAEIYQKGLASVGLLLAILGNLVGTYIGITIGQLCRMISAP